MVKNFLLVVMTIVSMMCFGYAFVQKIDADQKAELAVTLKMEVERAKTEEMQARAEADMQRLRALEAIADCEKRKK